MKFILETSGLFYSESGKNKLEKLGFHFTEGDKRNLSTAYMIKSYPKVEIEINSLEELMVLVEEFDDIIVSENKLEIYDYYREE